MFTFGHLMALCFCKYYIDGCFFIQSDNLLSGEFSSFTFALLADIFGLYSLPFLISILFTFSTFLAFMPLFLAFLTVT